jgi:DNA-binding NarL/FixJ family response regulator
MPEECGILLADAGEASRSEFKQCLKNTKYKVVAEVTNADDLMARYEQLRPELVVMCMSLPGHRDRVEGGGQQAMARIFKLHPKPRVVITHTLDTQYLVVSALKAGAIAAVRKPFKVDKTLEALAKGETSRGGAAAVQRAGVRLRKPLVIKYKKALDGFFTGKREAIADDISQTGISMRTQEQLAEKTILKIVIDLPGEKTRLKLRGQIMRAKPIVGVGQFDIGVAFVETDAHTQEQLRQFIVKTVAKSGGP